jgi:hypothetical protein
MQILKAVTMAIVTAIVFFWSFMRNPAMPRIIWHFTWCFPFYEQV